LAAASPAEALPRTLPPPPAVRASALPSVVLRVMPFCSSPTPIGYTYDATPDADGGYLAAASAFFSHQGHQVFTNHCPNLDSYHQAMGVSTTIISVNKLPDHILSSSLELMEGLFAPSPTNSLGTTFMAAYLDSPPSPCLASSRPVVPTSISTSIGFKNTGGIGSKGGASNSQMSPPGDSAGITTANISAPPTISNHLRSYCILLPPLRSQESVSLLLASYISLCGIRDTSSLGGIQWICWSRLSDQPPLPLVRRPDPEEELSISPCSHCGSLLPSLVSFVGRA
jgi:hypothetical protein